MFKWIYKHFKPQWFEIFICMILVLIFTVCTIRFSVLYVFLLFCSLLALFMFTFHPEEKR